jgi:hypothetical protein
MEIWTIHLPPRSFYEWNALYPRCWYNYRAVALHAQ